MNGTLVINEQPYAVTRLALEGGSIVFDFALPDASTCDPGDGRWLLFGPDGMLVVQGALTDDTRRDLAAKPPPGEWLITIALTYTDRMTERVRARLA